MPKCYFTCVELTFEHAFVLDLQVARRALADLRRRLQTLSRLVATLGEADEVDVYSAKHRKHTKVYQKRVVAASVAAALGAVAPEERLFLSYPSWKQKKKQRNCACGQTPSHPTGRTAVVVAILDALPDSAASGEAGGEAADPGGEP